MFCKKNTVHRFFFLPNIFCPEMIILQKKNTIYDCENREFQSYFFSFQMRSVNITEVFPLENSAALEKYLNKDPEYEDRKQQFFSVIIPVRSAKKKKFPNALLSAVFSLQFILDHRWPTEW